MREKLEVSENYQVGIGCISYILQEFRWHMPP